MVEQNPQQVFASDNAAMNKMSQRELIEELTLLKVQMAHVVEENVILKMKVKLSDKTVSQLAGK